MFQQSTKTKYDRSLIFLHHLRKTEQRKYYVFKANKYIWHRTLRYFVHLLSYDSAKNS